MNKGLLFLSRKRKERFPTMADIAENRTVGWSDGRMVELSRKILNSLERMSSNRIPGNRVVVLDSL